MRNIGYFLLILLLFTGVTQAEIVDTWQFNSGENQARAIDLAKQLRCPQCQNQNLVESTSLMARDLRLEVYRLVDNGESNTQIVKLMTRRFGDFVLYKPRLAWQTLLLWFGPAFMLLLALIASICYLRRCRTASPILNAEQRRRLDNLLQSHSENHKS